MNTRVASAVVVLLGALLSGSSYAQRMFIDTNGDGTRSETDALFERGVSHLDIWVETNYRGVGAVAANTASDEALTINSYEFVLHAEGGTVEWGKFENNLPTMSTRVGPFTNGTDFYVGQFGFEKLPAGRYKLGSIPVTVRSGSPEITFAEQSSVWHGAGTSFGSLCPGKEETNTLHFAIGAGGQGSTRGDWDAAEGVKLARGGASASLAEGRPALRFEARIAGNGVRVGPELVIITTKRGPLKARLFDVSGRLVRVMVDHGDVGSGTHNYPLARIGEGRRLPGGVYYYKVESPEGILTGKVAITQ